MISGNGIDQNRHGCTDDVDEIDAGDDQQAEHPCPEPVIGFLGLPEGKEHQRETDIHEEEDQKKGF